ncbi:hypothetical protein Tco_0652427 [Tanacetum coccineum]|uniref:Zinc finger, CCHC-type n=1 Tax=Tanacetum coccineum TaxID=301880 RepID=A0ABQ4WXI5_9ASTR
MLLKQKDPMVLENKVNIKPVNYVVLNQLSKDFGKCFVPQQELSAEQAFHFQMSNPSNDSSDASPVKVDIPSELPKVLENQLLSVSLLICPGKHDCVERIPSGDGNPILTLGDYSKPSHKGYRNTIELPTGNNMVPLRSDTIRLVQNECSFYGLWSEDPNQHLTDFLKLMDSLDLDGENRERTRLHLFQFSLRDQARNWLKRLLAGLPDSLLNSFHREGPQNSATIS